VHGKLNSILKIHYASWNFNSTRRTEVAAQATSLTCFAGIDESLHFLILGTTLSGLSEKCKRI
jgi:hypothetical protein